MAEPTGVEPVPADRQSAILPIDHSSGSLPWTRTTISAFRAQRPSIGRRGNLDLVKELVVGTMTPIRASSARFKFQSPATDDPASSLQRYRFHAPYAQHRGFIEVVAETSAIAASTVHKFTVISAAIAIQLGRKLDFKTIEFNRLHVHNLVAARRIKLPSQP